MRGASFLAALLAATPPALAPAPPAPAREDALAPGAGSSTASPTASLIGTWVTYRAVTPSGLALFVRLAAVGEDPAQDAVWLEVEAGLAPSLAAPMLRLLLLHAREGGGLGSRTLRAFAAPAHEPFRELDPAAVQGWVPPRPTAEPLPEGWEMRRQRAQALETRAGKVEVESWELRHRGEAVHRVYLSGQVPLLGLAGLELPGEAVRLVVEAWGRSATPHGSLPPPIPTEASTRTTARDREPL